MGEDIQLTEGSEANLETSISNRTEGDGSETPKRYQCPQCPKAYARRDYLERHALNHVGRLSQCLACGKSFSRPDVLRKHQSSHCRAYAESEVDYNREDVKPADEGSSKRKRVRKSHPESTQGPSSSMRESASSPTTTSVSQSQTWEEPPKRWSKPQPDISKLAEGTLSTSFPNLGSHPFSARESFDGPLGPPPVNPFASNTFPTDPSQAFSTASAPSVISNSQEPPGNSMDDLLSWLFNQTDTNDLGSVTSFPSASGIITPIPPTSASAMATFTSSTTSHLPPSLLPSPAVPLAAHATVIQPPLTKAALQGGTPRPIPHATVPLDRSPFPSSWSRQPTSRVQDTRDVVNEQSRNAILGLFDVKTRAELETPVWHLQQMRLYFELYFIHFAPLYPIIHRPSLSQRQLAPDLLMTILSIGSAFAENKTGLEIASNIIKYIRFRIFEMVEDEPRAPLDRLQTILLIDHFSRLFCSTKHHDVAQIHHSSSIIMARLAGALLPRLARKQSSIWQDEPMKRWLDWVEEEERIRLGWFTFMADTENAALFRHLLLIHSFFMAIDFPVEDSVWNAPDPFSWNDSLQTQKSEPSFQVAIREIAGKGTVPPQLSPNSLFIVLHGLVSVSWTLLWRDLGDFCMVHENQIVHWKDSLRRAFGNWANHMEDLLVNWTEAGEDPADLHVYWAGVPLAYMGISLLLTDTEQVRIFSGARYIAGRSISPAEWARTSTYVNAWARSQDGAYSCAAAVNLLTNIFKWSSEARFRTSPSIIAFCGYIATLIVWTYASSLDGHDRLEEPFIVISHTPASLLAEGETKPPPKVHIEPSLARRGAMAYLARLRGCSHPFDLAELPGKNRCGSVVAYMAYLCGMPGRGILEQSREVLLGLLTEHS